MSEWKQLYAEVLDREPPDSLSLRISILAADAHADEPKTGWSRRLAVGLVAAAVTVTVLIVLALAAHSRSSAPAPAGSHIPILGPGTNGWVAVDVTRPGGGIALVRPGKKARRLVVAGSAGAAASCPSWSPDGTKLLFGRVTGSSGASLVIVPVSSNGAAGAPKVIALNGFGTLDPCGMWSPDGRWIALRGPLGGVWVVDTQTGAIRRLPRLSASDLEWRPGTDDLAIAGWAADPNPAYGASTPVTIYSTATGELSRLGDVKAANITWSPDGKTLAYTRGGPGEDVGPRQLWLVDADGTNKRLLVANLGRASHGIGPVWSPAGDRIAYQREILGWGESHEVVLVNVADGSQRTIAPPVATSKQFRLDRREHFHWYPWAVWWAPDGTTLLYAAWNDGILGASGEVTGLIAVPADRPHHASILVAGDYDTNHQWPIQVWGRQPE